MRKVFLITTGGTIEKTYDEVTGVLENRQTIVRRMIGDLRLEDTEVQVIELMHKDSLHLTDDDRRRIVDAVRLAGAERGDHPPGSGVVVLHGTDTLDRTGEQLRQAVTPTVPVVLTGAWRPFEMRHSDALQNLTEAIFATGVLPAGIYCVAHGRALPFPGVVKERNRSTFVRQPEAAAE